MAKIIITVEASASATVTVEKTLTIADLKRFLDSYRPLFDAFEADGVTPRPATDNEVVRGWAEKIFRDAQKQVRNAEARNLAGLNFS